MNTIETIAHYRRVAATLAVARATIARCHHEADVVEALRSVLGEKYSVTDAGMHYQFGFTVSLRRPGTLEHLLSVRAYVSKDWRRDTEECLKYYDADGVAADRLESEYNETAPALSALRKSIADAQSRFAHLSPTIKSDFPEIFK